MKVVIIKKPMHFELELTPREFLHLLGFLLALCFAMPLGG